MVRSLATRLEGYFENRVGDDLRSIILYHEDTHEISYLRDDVATQYSEEDLAQSIDNTRFDSLTKPLYEDAFSEDHGDLTCLVQAFEGAVEMNFVLADGEGVAVGVDATALRETNGLVADAWDILLEERTT